MCDQFLGLAARFGDMAPWLDPEELRVGLGRMRLPDEARALEADRHRVRHRARVRRSERWLAAALSCGCEEV